VGKNDGLLAYRPVLTTKMLTIMFYSCWFVDPDNIELDSICRTLDRNPDEQYQVDVWSTPNSTEGKWLGKVLTAQQVSDLILNYMTDTSQHQFWADVWREEM
jgi:hypothetical protein